MHMLFCSIVLTLQYLIGKIKLYRQKLYGMVCSGSGNVTDNAITQGEMG